MKFHTTILQTGKNTIGIEVPPEVVEALGAGKRPPLKVTVNGATYRSSIAVMGGRFMVGISAENRALTGAAGGDVVDVPPELAEALAIEPDTRRLFEGLSYSKQLWFALSVTDAKTPETRQRRIDKALSMLRQGRK